MSTCKMAQAGCDAICDKAVRLIYPVTSRQQCYVKERQRQDCPWEETERTASNQYLDWKVRVRRQAGSASFPARDKMNKAIPSGGIARMSFPLHRWSAPGNCEYGYSSCKDVRSKNMFT